MSKSRKTPTTRDSAFQLNLDFAPERGALADALDDAATEVSRMVRRGPFSPDQIVDQLLYLVGRKITKTTWSAWTAATNANRMPADVMVAVCTIHNNFSPLDTLLAPAGRSVATVQDRAAAEIGRIQIERGELAQREAAARRLLKGGK
ncbi:MAG: hypothetical protein P9L99_13370 [Candidatus Lernaella stagnicola]|nr:hypothetical protein [Candidatus Lernaella stagnicola]